MRTKNLLILLCCAALTTVLLLLFSPAGQHNESFNTLMSQTHQQLQEFHENLVATPAHRLDIDPKYLDLLGFTHPIYNGTRYNFTIVTYVWDAAHAAAAILLSQNVAAQLPNDTMLIYDLGLAADEARQLAGYCNSSRCSVIPYDLSAFPSYVSDEHMHAYRPLLIKDALCRSRAILFLENTQRVRADARDVYARLMAGARESGGVLGWATRLQAVSSLTHPKMFKFFDADVESFQFLQMVSLDMVVFVDTPTVNEKILLPWCKCALTMECIHPIGAQSGGCRYNKKPMYRYSGCHGYDASAFNIVLGLQWQFNASKYSSTDNDKLFYTESPEEATRQLESRRRNASDAAAAAAVISSSSGYGSEHTPMYGDMAVAH